MAPRLPASPRPRPPPSWTPGAGPVPPHFAARIEGQVNAAGRVSFKTFILCWTDNL